MTTLASPLRKKLQDAVETARVEAEEGIRSALIALEVAAEKPSRTLTPAETELRKRLRARARQLGDKRDPSGRHEVERLVTEAAYEHWHRMLFARFLAESHLLMHPDGVPVSLADCEELAADPSSSEGAKNGWELAGRYASRMLPQIFRVDSPCLALDMPAERQTRLEKLVAELPPETFAASDSLGWVYQFWQTRSKKAVNDSGVKIGARELPAVTQLFTEPYMVAFLLDNALGAWWAARRLSADDLKDATSEAELRTKASLPGVPLEYLRFVRGDDGTWAPAAGTFEKWPAALAELKVLDPCCGSGHFLVAVMLMLTPMRMELEALDARTAIDKVLSENLHGLELDPRCVELAAFALALNAWRYPGAGGYRVLPTLNVACSGLSVSAAKEEWKQLGLGKRNLGMALEWLHETFAQAPVLGSLIDPSRKEGVAKTVSWEELSEALDQALAKEAPSADAEAHEAAVTAQGLARAAKLMAAKYTWVVTNVPYLSFGKQAPPLIAYVERFFPTSQGDLATVFLERCLSFAAGSGTASLVLPQNWMFLPKYSLFRKTLLTRHDWNLLARLGARAFETITGEVVKVILFTISHQTNRDLLSASAAGQDPGLFAALDVASSPSAREKAFGLGSVETIHLKQAEQVENHQSRIVFGSNEKVEPLEAAATFNNGICCGDSLRFYRWIWELGLLGGGWSAIQSTVRGTTLFGGREQVLLWEDDAGSLRKFVAERLGEQQVGSWLRGKNAWGKSGVLVSAMQNLPVTIYSGGLFDENCVALIPKAKELELDLWTICSDPLYSESVREINQTLKVRGDLVQVAFDAAYWSETSNERYPRGLPQPYSDDPTQWIFHGHPCGSVVWDDTTKWTAHGPLRTDASVLQVAVARLLGYRWPAETDLAMELSDESRHWVGRCAELSAPSDLIDDDGIVCLPSVRAERPAADRLLDLIAKAYGPSWGTATRDALLASVEATGKGLEWWLREKFFEEHCATFQHRPFIWHIWDGLKKGGFGALVNYHKLDKKLLETLTYTYLADWITVQQADVSKKVDGAEERHAAAKKLQDKLKLILEGEKPYDIFVRWKPLHEQPIGWEPDLDDGVRLNIRPFMKAEVLRHNKPPKLNIHWKKDRGQDVPSAPWYDLGPKKGGNPGDRINDHHLTLEEKRQARATHTAKNGG